MKQQLVYAPDGVQILYLSDVEVFRYNHVHGFVVLGRKKHNYRPETFWLNEIEIKVG